eukprot:GHVL01003320.1.p1 GENE.GHVL01003320.1~~GHVL01003320.1.p1  ORF type:complete len:312 (+),score=33.84 GHVL01003320.1:48-983(+)
MSLVEESKQYISRGKSDGLRPTTLESLMRAESSRSERRPVILDNKAVKAKVHIHGQIFCERTASVYSATLVDNPNKELALKLSNMSVNPMVESELRKLYIEVAKLHNRRLLRVYSLALLDNQRAVLTERCKGPNLIEWVTRYYRKGLPESLAKRILRQMLEGLKVLHAAGIVHRDVKLDNLMFLDRDLRNVVLIDFDTMAAIDRSRSPHLGGRPAGTLEYMAPECADNYATTDPTRDMWAVGVTFFGLLTGSFPYHPKAGDRSSLKDALAKEPIIKVDLSPEARDLLYKFLCFDVSQRITASDALSHPFLQ